MKIKYIPQRYKKDCSVACVAMITRQPYNEVLNNLTGDFDKTGLKVEDSLEYIQRNGLTVIQKSYIGYLKRKLNNKRMGKPFADIHYVVVQPYADCKTFHAAVMDNKGKIYDPADRTIQTIDKYYEILVVGGCWYS
jgi:hypothetical protein